MSTVVERSSFQKGVSKVNFLICRKKRKEKKRNHLKPKKVQEEREREREKTNHIVEEQQIDIGSGTILPGREVGRSQSLENAHKTNNKKRERKRERERKVNK
jgi:hypothetical protein